jgi:hypothetical protein
MPSPELDIDFNPAQTRPMTDGIGLSQVVDGSGPMGKQNTIRIFLSQPDPQKGAARVNSSFQNHLLFMARSSMWSALARFFCSAHVGTGSETTVEQESQHIMIRKENDAWEIGSESDTRAGPVWRGS